MSDRENPNCLETHARFRVTGDKVFPDEIVRLSGVVADYTARKGDVVQKQRHKVVIQTGIWSISSEGKVSSTSLEVHLLSLIDRLKGKEALFQQLGKKGFTVEFHCYWMSETGYGGPILSNGLLSDLARFGADLDFDFYTSV